VSVRETGAPAGLGRARDARSTVNYRLLLAVGVIRLELFPRELEDGSECPGTNPGENFQLVAKGQAVIGEAAFRELFPHERGHGSPSGRLDLSQSVELVGE
jgi:hypothetical protein